MGMLCPGLLNLTHGWHLLCSLPRRPGNAQLLTPPSTLVAQSKPPTRLLLAFKGLTQEQPRWRSRPSTPPLPPHLPATEAAEATEIVKAAVALCLPALSVKEPAGSLLRWGSGQKSATEKLGSVALSTAGAVSTRPAVQKKGSRGPRTGAASAPPRGRLLLRFGVPAACQVKAVSCALGAHSLNG